MHQLASDDADAQQRGMILADKILNNNTATEISESTELKVKTNRTVINKYSENESDPNTMSQGIPLFYIYMRSRLSVFELINICKVKQISFFYTILL